MICFDIPLCIVAAFLVLTLVVGIYFSRQKPTFRQYAVGNKDFATPTLVATVLATLWGGGGLIRTVECVHNLGLWWITFVLLSAFGLWVISRLALRMGPFMQHLSMAETIGSIYGKYPKVITALVSICSSIVIVTAQINVITQAIIMCLGSIDPKLITILSTLLFILYSTFGGIRAVTFTDVLQFVTFSFIIPLLSWFIFVKVGKPVTEIVPMLQSYPKFQFSDLLHFNTQLIGMLLLTISNLISYIMPNMIQRVYMASDPMQARNVFAYANLFNFFIKSCIILVGLFVFVGAPDLPKTEIWSYIVAHIPPVFKGLLAISLVAMTMSTADSTLNTCAVMVSNDIVKSLHKGKEISDARQLRIARWTTLVVGLVAMLIAFQCKDLLKLMYWSLACVVPVPAAPFILAIYGFRGTSRTALIGMATGLLTILAWNKWVQPTTGMDGSFIAMLANGLAMMAAHYLLKQPKGAGWVAPDYILIQRQQENARKRAAQKQAIKDGLINFKDTLAQLKPSRAMVAFLGCYVILTNVLAYCIGFMTGHGYWLLPQLLVGACLVGYSILGEAKRASIPGWIAGVSWVIGLAFCLPIHVVWYWWNGIYIVLTLAVSLAHLAVTVILLPIYLGIGFIIATLCMMIYLSSIYTMQPLVWLSSQSDLNLLLLLRLGVTLLILGGVAYFKVKNGNTLDQIRYLKRRAALRQVRKIQEALYNVVEDAPSKEHGAILTQVVGKMEESISFLDQHTPLSKEDFKRMINNLYDWVDHFNRKARTKNHSILKPTKIDLDKLIDRVKCALSHEVSDPPKLLVEKINTPNKVVAPYLVCDANLIVYLLVQAILRMSRLVSAPSIVRLQLQATVLQYKQPSPTDTSDPAHMSFQAIGMVISQVNNDPGPLPKVKDCYEGGIDSIGPQEQQSAPPSLDLQQEAIAAIVKAHYGYLEAAVDGNPAAMLLVLPSEVTQVLQKMTSALPLDGASSTTPITLKEQAHSLMALMQCYDYARKASYESNPIDLATISELLLLLRQHFGYKRHASGQLLYVRSAGIAKLVVEWAFHAPKVMYAALLYELVCHACLSLAYLAAHYDLGVHAFVANVIAINQREALDHPSLRCVTNRLKKALKKDHIPLAVLLIKLAERLYDLRHAAGYLDLSVPYHMAQETLAIDVTLADKYLEPSISASLEAAARAVLEFCSSKQPGKKDKADKKQNEAR